MPMSSSFQDRPPPYFSSSQQLVGPQRGASRLESTAENPGMQVMAGSLLGAGREWCSWAWRETVVMEFAWGKSCWAASSGAIPQPWEVLPVCKNPGVGSMWREGILQRILQCPEGFVHEVPVVDPGGLGSCSAGRGVIAPCEGGYPFWVFKGAYEYLQLRTLNP